MLSNSVLLLAVELGGPLLLFSWTWRSAVADFIYIRYGYEEDW